MTIGRLAFHRAVPAHVRSLVGWFVTMSSMHSTITASRLLVCGLSLAVAMAGAVGPRAMAARLQADDPFADELNPFGTGKSQPPAAAPSAAPPPQEQTPPPRPAERIRPKLPVPFPDTATPGTGEPAGRRGRGSDRDGRPFARDQDEERGFPKGGDGKRDERGFGFEESDDTAERSLSEAEQKLAEADRLEQQGKLAEARDLLREVVKLDPSLPMGHLALGVVLRRMGDFRGSVEACTKGIEIDPLEPELYLRRGIAWFHLDLYGIALEDFEEAAGMAYDDPRPELWRGLTLIELDRPLEAINAYASAIRRDRTYMLAYLNRGLAYLSTNEPRKAEFDFNQALRQKPKDARAWFNRGVAQARQGRYREAIESYETALGITPNDNATRQNLEAARRLAGQDSARRSR